MQGQANGSDFIQVLLCSLQKHKLELFTLVGPVTNGVPTMIICKMVGSFFFTSICTS